MAKDIGVLKVEISVTDVEPLKGIAEYFGEQIGSGIREFTIMISDAEKGKGIILPVGGVSDKPVECYNFKLIEDKHVR